MASNKMKSHKGIRKRMKVTRKGKMTHGRAKRSHLMSGRSPKTKRHLRRKGEVLTSQLRTYKRLAEA